jgi:oligosaccharide repeat unit polymerase
MRARSFFTPTAVLCITWIVFLMGQAILAPDMIFSLEAGLLVFSLIVSFCIGEYVELFPSRTRRIRKMDSSAFRYASEDRVFQKRLERVIWTTGAISVAGSILYLFIFIRHFGSFVGLLTAGWAIREEIGTGAISVPLSVRMLFLLAYPVISLALVHWVLFGFRWFLFLPFLAILIFGATQAARAAIFIVIIWVFLANLWKDMVKRGCISAASIAKRIVLYPVLVLMIFIMGLMYREQSIGTMEDYSRYLHVFNVYTFGGISALSAFLDSYKNSMEMTLGLYSFSSFFELLGIKKLSFGFYDEYLVISRLYGDTTNVYTMFRPLIEDFGLAGSHIYMLLLGAISSKIYAMTLRGSLPALASITALYTLLVYSPIAPFTQHTSLLLCLIIPAVLIKATQFRYVYRPSASSLVSNEQ